MLDTATVFNGFYQRSAWLMRASGKERLLMLTLQYSDSCKNGLLQVGRAGGTATSRALTASVPLSHLVPPCRPRTPARAYIYAPHVRAAHNKYIFMFIKLTDKVGQWDGYSINKGFSRPTLTTHLKKWPTFKKSAHQERV